MKHYCLVTMYSVYIPWSLQSLTLQTINKLNRFQVAQNTNITTLRFYIYIHIKVHVINYCLQAKCLYQNSRNKTTGT